MSGTLPVYTSTAELTCRLISSILYIMSGNELAFIFKTKNVTFAVLSFYCYFNLCICTEHCAIGTCMQTCIQAWWPYKLLSNILSCFNTFYAKWTSQAQRFFTFTFGVSFIIFISIKWCGILLFLTHNAVQISPDILWDLMCFQRVPLNFFFFFWAV